MADIFISYARADRDKIEKLSQALEAEGYSVWWDRHIAGGADFSQEIERELTAAKTVIAAWSKEAVASTWVKDEAIVARDANKLIPISLDGVQSPLGFKQFHLVDLAGWKGGAANPAFDELLHSIRARLSGEMSAAPEPAKTSWPDRLKRPVPATVIGLVVLIVAVTAFNFLSAPSIPRAIEGAPETLRAAAPEKSIAILPFADMSEAGDQEYFSDGIAEEILNALVKIDDLHVAGRTSSFVFKGENIDLREVGRTLNVTHILEGSVRKQGDAVRITAQLVKSEDGFHLWSESYDGTLEDIFSLQESISQSVAAEMKVLLGRGQAMQLADTLTDNNDAYDLFLKGRDLLEQRLKEGAVQEGIALLREAVALDPDFAEAWASYAEGMIVLPDYNEDTAGVRETQAEARRAARKALTLKPDLALAHGVLSMADYYNMDFASALAGSNEALALAPDNPRLLLWRGAVEIALGNLQNAASVVRQAVNIDPLSDSISANYSGILYLAGDFDEAERVALRNEKLGLTLSAGYIRAETAFARGDKRAAIKIRLEDLDILFESQPPEERNPQLIRDAKLAYRGVYGGLIERAVISTLMATYAPDDDIKIPDNYLVLILQLGEWEAFLKRFRNPDASYSGAVWSAVWDGYKSGPQTLRKQKQFRDFIEDIGIADIWRERGWPDLCRPLPGTDGSNGQWECD